jgi:DNA polymerase I-like protein with 3'-5' exonuclease and polymerase domains
MKTMEMNEYMEDAGDHDDDNSTFSTVDGRRKDLDGLKKSGRMVWGEADEAATQASIDGALRDCIEELEEEKLLVKQNMNQKVSALQKKYDG